MIATTSTSPGLGKLSEAQLRGLLARFAADRGHARLLVVGAVPEWDGPEVLDTDHGPVRIVCGTSVLAVRVAMVDHPDETLVVLTDRPMHELGSEVAAQAWRGRIERPSPWNAVLALFRAKEIDPQLRGKRWMVDLLVQRAPANRGYPQPIGGVLTTEIAWETCYRHVLGVPTEPTTVDLVRWVASGTAGAALALIDDDEARTQIAARLARQAGPAAPTLLEVAEHGDDHDVVPLGLAIDALWPRAADVPRALLEAKHLGDRRMSDAAAVDWARASHTIAESYVDHDQATLSGLIQRAETLLDGVQGSEHATSTWLPSGLTNAVNRVGTTLTAALDTDDDQQLASAADAVELLARHRDVTRDRLRLCRAAVRVLRRRSAATPVNSGDGDLTALTWNYLDDGGWLDAARERLAIGDTDATLADVARRLLAEIDDERHTRDRTFAAAIASQATGHAPDTSLDNRRPLRIENVLSTVVAPVAAQGPTFLFVVDGLSHAAAIPLLSDLREEGWQPHGPSGRRLPGVLATLPSKTICSRATLLSGRLTTGGADVERAGFSSHTALIQASVGGAAPVLFHKNALRAADGHVATEVRAALTDSSRRVVGVVFNGVDDFLGDLDQLRLADGLAGMPLLEELLNEAMAGGRTVVLTSDHGHVLEGDTYVAGSGGGERYRLPDDTPPGDGEIELTGARVLDGQGHIIAAADGRNRYTTSKRRGYHGGATPAEMLCPLVVLCAGATSPDGWEPMPVDTPAWWDPSSAAIEVAPVEAAIAEPVDSSPQPGLFDEPTPEPASGPPAWIRQLLDSPLLASQRRLASRSAADDDTLAAVLQVLVAAGGTASGATLERSLDTTPMRLRGLLNGVRSLLDVDGYAVLKVEADGTAQLDLRRLAEQFELRIPDVGSSS